MSYSGVVVRKKAWQTSLSEMHFFNRLQEGRCLPKGDAWETTAVPSPDRAWAFRLLKFAIGTDDFFRFLAVFAGGEQGGAGAQNLGLMLSGTSVFGIKVRDETDQWVKVEVKKFITVHTKKHSGKNTPSCLLGQWILLSVLS